MDQDLTPPPGESPYDNASGAKAIGRNTEEHAYDNSTYEMDEMGEQTTIDMPPPDEPVNDIAYDAEPDVVDPGNDLEIDAEGEVAVDEDTEPSAVIEVNAVDGDADVDPKDGIEIETPDGEGLPEYSCIDENTEPAEEQAGPLPSKSGDDSRIYASIKRLPAGSSAAPGSEEEKLRREKSLKICIFLFLCVLIFVIVGLVGFYIVYSMGLVAATTPSPTVTTTATEPPLPIQIANIAVELNLTFNDKNFTDALYDSNSTEYMELEAEILMLLDGVLQSGNFSNSTTEVVGFRPGSVVVIFLITLDSVPERLNDVLVEDGSAVLGEVIGEELVILISEGLTNNSVDVVLSNVVVEEVTTTTTTTATGTEPPLPIQIDNIAVELNLTFNDKNFTNALYDSYSTEYMELEAEILMLLDGVLQSGNFSNSTTEVVEFSPGSVVVTILITLDSVPERLNDVLVEDGSAVLGDVIGEELVVLISEGLTNNSVDVVLSNVVVVEEVTTATTTTTTTVSTAAPTPEPPSNTPEPPSNTPEPPSNTPEPPSNTPEPPSNTPEPPSNTPEPPSNTTEPPSNTPEPPSNTPEPPSNTPEPPSNTPEPPSNTPEPPSNTPEPPSNTPEPPSNTPEPSSNITCASDEFTCVAEGTCIDNTQLCDFIPHCRVSQADETEDLCQVSLLTVDKVVSLRRETTWTTPATYPSRDIETPLDYILYRLSVTGSSVINSHILIDLVPVIFTGDDSVLFIGRGHDPVQALYNRDGILLTLQAGLANNISFTVTTPNSEAYILLQKAQADNIEINIRLSAFQCASEGAIACERSAECYVPTEACDGIEQCQNGDDEAGCSTPDDCHNCTTSWEENTCLPSYWICDGTQDCSDNSDEIDCPTPPVYTCFDCESISKCVLDPYWVCDGLKDCNNGEDEFNCSATDYPCFECESNFACILDPYWVCDRVKDCNEGEDELYCTATDYPCFECESRFECVYAPDWVCDGVADCYNGEDELNCTTTPPANYTCFECASRYECVNDPDWVCDGVDDCFYGEDELNCPSTTYPANSTCLECDSSFPCVFDPDWVCDGYQDCFFGEDELNCTKSCFECESFYSCVSDPYWVCDGEVDCFYGEDELNCTSTEACPGSSFACPEPDSTCINETLVCDFVPDCRASRSDEAEDLCMVSQISEDINVPFNQYRWIVAPDAYPSRDIDTPQDYFLYRASSPPNSHLLIEIINVIFDGNDSTLTIGSGLDPVQAFYDNGILLTFSDVFGWNGPVPLRLSTPGNEAYILLEKAPEGNIQISLRLSSFQCTREDDIPCSYSNDCYQLSEICDGVVHCELSEEDEIDCTLPTPDPCHNCTTSWGEDTCLPSAWVCDGSADCLDESDELDCPQPCFPCNSSRCVLWDWLCDGTYDCYDLSDELACNGTVDPTCFPCYSDFGCVVDSWVCNGVSECADGSDEEYCGDCGVDQYPCFFDDTTCFNASDVCDGIYDCPSGADEFNCTGCFACSNTSTCLIDLQVCNFYNDCPGGEDETESLCNHTQFIKNVEIQTGEWMFFSEGYVRERILDDRDTPASNIYDFTHYGFNSDPGTTLYIEIQNFTVSLSGPLVPLVRISAGSGADPTDLDAARGYIDGYGNAASISDSMNFSLTNNTGFLLIAIPKSVVGIFNIIFRVTAIECVSPEVACNGSPHCYDWYDDRCDGEIQCLDSREDEFGCDATPPANVSCFECASDYGCVYDPYWVCDGYDHCFNGEDEMNCTTSPPANVSCFECASDYGCVYDPYWVCDGYKDCYNREDELNCTTTPPANVSCFECASDYGCVYDPFWVCDGDDDCSFGEDELNCTTTPPANVSCFECASDYGCVYDPYWVCDGYDHCFNGEDEMNCTTSPPANVSCFECASDYGCVYDPYWVCDGYKDCYNREDELNCTTTPPANVSCFECASDYGCVYDPFWVCDGDDDCSFGEDELNCTTTPPANVSCFECASDYGCVYDPYWVCDGYDHCFNGEDEMNCTTSPPANVSCFECASDYGCVYDPYWVCDGYKDCYNREDELNCTTTPPANVSCFECASDYGCVYDPSWVCDGDDDCSFGEDELNCTTTPPANVSCFECASDYGCVYDPYWVCDGYDHCFNGEDEMNCTTNPPTNSSCFECASDYGCVYDPYWVCDGYDHCFFGEDELNCTICGVDQYPCFFDNTTCFNASDVCDGIYDCPSGVDEYNCTGCFACSNTSTCLSDLQVCNFYNDCPGGEDETESLCNHTQFIKNVEIQTGEWMFFSEGYVRERILDDRDTPASNIYEFIHYGFNSDPGTTLYIEIQNFTVSLSGPLVPLVRVSAGSGADPTDLNAARGYIDGYGNAASISYSMNFSLTDNTGFLLIAIPKSVVGIFNIIFRVTAIECVSPETACYGSPHCYNWLDDRCDGEIQCLDSREDEFGCDATPPANYTCFECASDYECVYDPYWVCNGVYDCYNGEDEFNCTISPVECFQCESSSLCVFESWVCDREVDCYNGEDELNCIPGNSSCFFCENSGDCVPWDYVCDGAYDCYDISDEKNCNTTTDPACFPCYSSGCVQMDLVCDGEADCRDGSDERDCNSTGLPCFQCATDAYNCINLDYVCDEDPDCDDGSDEWNCICGVDQYPCFFDNTTCFNASDVCDEIYDCPSGVDEYNCTGCFACSNTSTCLSDLQVCNFYNDCPGGEDETESLCNHTQFIKNVEIQTGEWMFFSEGYVRERILDDRDTPASNIYEFIHYGFNSDPGTTLYIEIQNFTVSLSGPLVPLVRVSAGSGADPTDLNAARGYIDGYGNAASISYSMNFSLTDNTGFLLIAIPKSVVGIFNIIFRVTAIECVSPEAACYGSPHCYNWLDDRCDGEIQCLDSREDEFGCEATPPANYTCFECASDYECVYDPYWVCNGVDDCYNGEDEFNCTISPVECFQCDSSSLCVFESWVCDGEEDCNNGEDELNCVPGNSSCFFCESSGDCIPWYWVCDGAYDCYDISDEKNCSTTPDPACFPCYSFGCVQMNWVCDGDADCRDGSDERDCNSTGLPCFQCATDAYNCINLDYVCDEDPDCDDGSDEWNCTNCFECQTHPEYNNCIEWDWVCDKEIDCFDGTDELDCDVSPLPCVQCNSSWPCVQESWACDGEVDCYNGEDEADCNVSPLPCIPCNSSWPCVQESWVCDGEVDCYNGEDEADCNGTCFECQTHPRENNCIEWDRICDREIDCFNGTDELDCDVPPLPCIPCDSAFPCVPESWVCDGDLDCYNGEDEVDCNACEVDEVPCYYDNTCVESNRTCDGDFDCPGGVDEYNCPGCFSCSGSSECLYDVQVCDFYAHCPGQEDESESLCKHSEFIKNVQVPTGDWVAIEQRSGGDENRNTPASNFIEFTHYVFQGEPGTTLFMELLNYTWSEGPLAPLLRIYAGAGDGPTNASATAVYLDGTGYISSISYSWNFSLISNTGFALIGFPNGINASVQLRVTAIACESPESLCIGSPHCVDWANDTCNGEYECVYSQEDELNCDGECDEFCFFDESSCLYYNDYCDGEYDCAAGEDEYACGECFTCPGSSSCLLDSEVCDFYDSCFEGEDEGESLCKHSEFITEMYVPTREWITIEQRSGDPVPDRGTPASSFYDFYHYVFKSEPGTDLFVELQNYTWSENAPQVIPLLRIIAGAGEDPASVPLNRVYLDATGYESSYSYSNNFSLTNDTGFVLLAFPKEVEAYVKFRVTAIKCESPDTYCLGSPHCYNLVNDTCDGEIQCLNSGEDESFCYECETCFYGDGCLPANYTCDFNFDCPNNEDELEKLCQYSTQAEYYDLTWGPTLIVDQPTVFPFTKNPVAEYAVLLFIAPPETSLFIELQNSVPQWGDLAQIRMGSGHDPGLYNTTRYSFVPFDPAESLVKKNLTIEDNLAYAVIGRAYGALLNVTLKVTVIAPCGLNEFRCERTGECIGSEFVCNLAQECTFAEDERSCGYDDISTDVYVASQPYDVNTIELQPVGDNINAALWNFFAPNSSYILFFNVSSSYILPPNSEAVFGEGTDFLGSRTASYFPWGSVTKFSRHQFFVLSHEAFVSVEVPLTQSASVTMSFSVRAVMAPECTGDSSICVVCDSNDESCDLALDCSQSTEYRCP